MLEAAADEARGLWHPEVGPADILLALTKVPALDQPPPPSASSASSTTFGGAVVLTLTGAGSDDPGGRPPMSAAGDDALRQASRAAIEAGARLAGRAIS